MSSPVHANWASGFGCIILATSHVRFPGVLLMIITRGSNMYATYFDAVQTIESKVTVSETDVCERWKSTSRN